MRFIFILLICVLTRTCVVGQYTYFNKFVDQQEYNVSTGNVTNLIIADSILITFGVYASDTAYMDLGYFSFNLEGLITNQQMFGTVNDEYWYVEDSESFLPIEDGYLSSGSFHDFNYQVDLGKVKKFNLDFTQEWEFSIGSYQDDVVKFSEYSVARVYDNNSIISAGQVGYDTLPNIIGDTHANMILTKISSSGDSIWHFEYPFQSDQYFNLVQSGVRVTDLYFTINGDILVFGYWYDNLSQPFVIRFNSEGEFISHQSFGGTIYFSYFPFAVDAGNDIFYFAYNQGVAYLADDMSQQKPRLGKLDASGGGLEVTLFPEFDHIVPDCRVFDLERTPDGGLVILGEYYLYPNPDEIPSASAYMLKCDTLGNEEWYHKYYPPMANYFTPEPYDLEITPDGGLAFAGNFEDGNTGDFLTWVVKTDACGEEVYNGCPYVGVNESHAELDSASLKIAPNPANDVVNISSTQEFESIIIRDITGRIVYREQMPNHTLNKSLSLREVGIAGLYLAEVDFGGGRVGAQKLVVE